MALGRTLHGSDWGSDAKNDPVSGSFTPAANAKLYVWAWGESSSSFTISVADSIGSSFTQVHDTGLLISGSSNRGRGYLWEMDTGGSPASRTVTITSTGGFGTCYAIWSVTGTSPQIKSGQSVVDGLAGGGSGNLVVGDFPVAATSGNLVMCVVGANIDTVGPFPTPSGFSVVVANVRPDGNHYEAPALFDRTDFTGVNTTISNTGNSGNNFAGVLLEFEEGGPPPEPVPILLESGLGYLLTENGTALLG